MHSLATDKSVFPRAGAAFAVTALPRKGSASLFLMDQDTGGAIRSAGRSDIFFGSGPEMEDRAGYMYAEGRLYYVFVK
jgi:membrane-bound lytic murein transglycosylase A